MTQTFSKLYVAQADPIRGQEPRIRNTMPAIRLDDNGREVAVITATGATCENHSPIAYASILAAAPDLLEALENTLQFAEACHRSTDDDLMRQAIGNDIMAARKAIAKARGQK